MMQIHYGFEGIAIISPCVTIGAFDGIHLGHRKVIQSLTGRARQNGGESVLVTFYPHPRKVVQGTGAQLPLLTTFREKASLLGELGVDHLILAQFDHELSNKEACEFISEILVRKIGCRCLILGFNHHFGKRGEGSFDTIKECAEKLNLDVEQVEAAFSGQTAVSSSVIRDLLCSGRLAEANEMLGYNYFITGIIVEGRQIGRKIGYPTANIDPGNSEKLIPMNGVYAVEIFLQEEKLAGVMSIGFNPTIDKTSTTRTIEVHIFDFDSNIYGSEVRVCLRYRLRDEVAFRSMEELASQIEIDRAKALELLAP